MQLTPIAAAPATPAPMKLKDDPVRPRGRREPVESDIYAATPEPVVQERRRLPWRRAGVTAAVLVVGMFTGRAYLDLPGADPLSAESSPASTGAAGPASPGPAPANTGLVEIETQPTGARVLLDGKPVGESPLTLDRVPAGRHTFTFLSAAGSLKRTVRVEAGRTLKLDVPIFSGWVAIYAPFVLDVAVGRQTIGTTEEARIMLSPGRHELTLTNRALGYRSVQSVDIEPGEVRTVTIDPRGTVNLNAQPWAEVWVDGQKVGDTPLARLQLPLGTREVIFRHPQLGERRVTVTVKGNAPAAVSVDMTQPGG
ncbi:MAG: PEGA domain-containing protein [Acidobacteria bacterium]|nr:PEGA domain-containing protein [Acidobacteriota bacterium]